MKAKLSSKLSAQTSHECILFKNNSVAAIGLRVRFYYDDATVNDSISMRVSYLEDVAINKFLGHPDFQ